MTYDKNRWITSTFIREDKSYYLRALDISSGTTHHVMIPPNGTVSSPTLPLDPAGKWVDKRDLPQHITKAILAYLTEAQLTGHQLPLGF